MSVESALIALNLYQNAAEEITRTTMRRALATALLPAKNSVHAAEAADLLLQRILQKCSRKDVRDLRQAIHAEMDDSVQMQGRASSAFAVVAGRLGLLDTQNSELSGPIAADSLSALQGIQFCLCVIVTGYKASMQNFVSFCFHFDDVSTYYHWHVIAVAGLFLLWPCVSAHACTPPSPILCARLLSLVQKLAALHFSNPKNASETVHWALQSAHVALGQLDALQLGNGTSLQHLVARAVLAVAEAPWAVQEVENAVALVLLHPNPRPECERLISALAFKALKKYAPVHHTTAFIAALGAASQLYIAERQVFAQSLISSSSMDLVEDANGHVHVQAHDGMEHSEEHSCSGYLNGEEQASRVQSAAQAYLDRVLQTQRSVPACFLPWLLSLVSQSSDHSSMYKYNQENSCLTVAALRAMRSMAALSQGLCGQCLGAIETAELMHGSSQVPPSLRIAAIECIEVAIATFPTAFSGHLHSISSTLLLLRPEKGAHVAESGVEEGQRGAAHVVGVHAAAAVARLTLSNKLKASDTLACLATVISTPCDDISNVGVMVLGRLMQQSSSAEEQAALFMGAALLQTSPAMGSGTLRKKSIEAIAGQLLSSSDRKHDAFVRPVLHAALAALKDEDAQAAVALLRFMEPSAKMLRVLQSSLQNRVQSHIPEIVRKELVQFVHKSFMATQRGQREDSGGIPVAEVSRKRSREKDRRHFSRTVAADNGLHTDLLVKLQELQTRLR